MVAAIALSAVPLAFSKAGSGRKDAQFVCALELVIIARSKQPVGAVDLDRLRDRNRCLPFVRIAGESESGPRIGGRPPRGISPQGLGPKAAYVLTVQSPRKQDEEISVFVDLEELWKKFPANRIRRLDGLISVIHHPPSVRAKHRRFAASVSENPLQFKRPLSDAVRDGKRALSRWNHKVGGQPHLYSPDLKRPVRDLLSRGFFHFLQLDFIVVEDADWDGDWYFGDGLFHLFCRPTTSAAWDWRWLWQM